MADNILITQGTASAIATDYVGTTHYQVIKLDVGADGLSSAFTGTIGAVTNLAGGSVKVTAGTTVVTTGTITAGTVESVNMPHGDYYGSIGTIAGTATGTVKAGVGGSAIYVTDIMVSTSGSTDLTIGNGTGTVPIWGPVYLAANGGAVANFVTPIKTGSGSALIMSQTGAGTVTVCAQGYVD